MVSTFHHLENDSYSAWEDQFVDRCHNSDIKESVNLVSMIFRLISHMPSVELENALDQKERQNSVFLSFIYRHTM